MTLWWRIAHRYYAARCRRAARRAMFFRERSEKFYRRIKGVAS